MPDRPLRADAQRNRAKILRAARDAFAASGYGVPLDDIAALAGVGPGQAFFAFLGRVAQEAAVKRDLPDAIEIAGALQDNLHAALDALLHRAQQAGAVRGDISTPDIIVLLKGLIRSIQEASAVTNDPRLSDRLFAVVTDGLRPAPPDDHLDAVAPGG